VEGVRLILEAVNIHNEIQHLSLIGSNQNACVSIKKNIERLIQGNRIGDEGAPVVAEFLKKNHSLLALGLSGLYVTKPKHRVMFKPHEMQTITLVIEA